jgi:hypothetical protein
MHLSGGRQKCRLNLSINGALDGNCMRAYRRVRAAPAFPPERAFRMSVPASQAFSAELEGRDEGMRILEALNLPTDRR